MVRVVFFLMVSCCLHGLRSRLRGHLPFLISSTGLYVSSWFRNMFSFMPYSIECLGYVWFYVSFLSIYLIYHVLQEVYYLILLSVLVWLIRWGWSACLRCDSETVCVCGISGCLLLFVLLSFDFLRSCEPIRDYNTFYPSFLTVGVFLMWFWNGSTVLLIRLGLDGLLSFCPFVPGTCAVLLVLTWIPVASVDCRSTGVSSWLCSMVLLMRLALSPPMQFPLNYEVAILKRSPSARCVSCKAMMLAL